MSQSYPSAPPPGADALSHIAYLRKLIAASTGFTFSDRVAGWLRVYFSRVGPGCYEDLSAWVFLECWAAYIPSKSLTDDAVLLAADRVRQRLTREAKRFRDGPAADSEATSDLPPEEEIELVIGEFHNLLRTRDARDAILFQRHYLDGASPHDIAAETGIPLSTVYRRIKAIRDDFVSLRASRQRPSASG